MKGRKLCLKQKKGSLALFFGSEQKKKQNFRPAATFECVCAKSVSFENVLNVSTYFVNFIRPRGLNLEPFSDFLQTELDADHDCVIYFSKGRLLSCLKVLRMIFF